MTLTQDHKNEIGKQLTRRIGQALKEGDLGVEELPSLADFILSEMGKVDSHTGMVNFLLHLSEEYPFFAAITMAEKAQAKHNEEQLAVEKIEDLLENRQIDQALQTANQAMGGK